MDSNSVVAQLIVIRWTKRSRGGDAARVRSSVPHGFRLPLMDTGPLVHRVDCFERDGFVPHFSVDDRIDRIALEVPARIHLEGGGIKVGFDRNSRPAAPPSRRLRVGEWLRWKDSSSGRTSARLTILNVGVFEVPEVTVFLGGPTFTATTVRPTLVG